MSIHMYMAQSAEVLVPYHLMEGGGHKGGGAGGGVQCAYTSTQPCTQHSSAPSRGPGALPPDGQDAVGPMYSAL